MPTMIMCMYPCVIVLFDRVNIIQDKTSRLRIAKVAADAPVLPRHH